jgi:hypothetical protein
MFDLGTSLAAIQVLRFTQRESYAITVVYTCVVDVLFHSITLSLYSSFYFVYSELA